MRRLPFRGCVRRSAAVLVLACALVHGSAVSAGSSIFRWVDAQGNLHLTDTLAEVPEPYFSMYTAKLREAEERKNNRAASAEGTAAAPARVPESLTNAEADARVIAAMPQDAGAEGEVPAYVREAKRRTEWKALIAHWREELEAATQELGQRTEEVGELTVNPLLRETPAVRQAIATAEALRLEAMRRVERARQMLLTELPARAKKDMVPPAWWR